MGPAVALLADGWVLVAGSAPFSGGHFDISSPQSSLYEPRTGTWKATTPLPDNSHGQAFILPDGSIDVVGPAATFAPVATLINAQRYEPARATWTASDAGMATPLVGVSSLPDGSVLGANGRLAQTFTPPTHRLPITCSLSLAGTDSTGHAFIRVAARDISSGLKSVNLVKAANATVALPRFPSLSRDHAVTIATKIDPSQPSTLTLQVTNAAGQSITCDPVLAELRDKRHGRPYVFKDLPQAENKVQLINRSPGLERVELRVNGRRFRMDRLQVGEERALDVGPAMLPGNHNIIGVQTHGPRGSSAVLVISDRGR
jgi:hypothetical protein